MSVVSPDQRPGRTTRRSAPLGTHGPSGPSGPMDLLGAFCSSSSCGTRRCRGDIDSPGPERQQSRGHSNIFEHLRLRPSVVDDGELLFPPRSQLRHSPPRGSSAPRQGSAASRPGRTQHAPYAPYTGADFSDAPSCGLPGPAPGPGPDRPDELGSLGVLNARGGSWDVAELQMVSAGVRPLAEPGSPQRQANAQLPWRPAAGAQAGAGHGPACVKLEAIGGSRSSSGIDFPDE